ncbi:MAG: lipopolysaccharide biosynthesis protein [Gammaproteobacteria bacterium]|nr:lipopolysaccharide biosynthesis protein [Gammaproteobacteria bacterium]
MEQQKNNLVDYLITARRTKGMWVTALVVIFVIGVGVAFGLPPVYRSSATILIEQQEIPQELVRSTVTTYADQRIQVISQRVMTRANLVKIIKKYDLYIEEQEKDPLEVVLEEMRKDIEMKMVSAEVVDPRSGRPTMATIAFTLTYFSESPTLAQKVANELASLYLNENIMSRREQATEATGFLTDEADKLRDKIADLERLLAVFKEKNVNQLPELTQLNMQLLDRSDTQLLEVERQLRSIDERKIYLNSQLAQLSPNNTQYTETGERILSSMDRLKSLQAKYVSISAIYSQDHPDLIKLNKQIAALEQEVGEADDSRQLRVKKTHLETELALAVKTYGEEHPNVKKLNNSLAKINEVQKNVPDTIDESVSKQSKPDNPAYIRMLGDLEAADAEYRSLLQKQEELLAMKQDYEARLTNAPQVEREYRSLSRDYESAVMKYREINAKQMQAQLAEVLELERKGERFTLIEPPQLPEEPVRPNRLAVVFLGGVFSLVGGAGSIVVSHSMDQTIRGATGIQSLLGSAPLSVIPNMRNDEERGRTRRRLWWVLLSLCVLVCAAIAIFHWLVMPIDVLWYAGLRRLGI